MKFRIKTLAALIVVMLSCCALAACGSDDNDDEPAPDLRAKLVGTWQCVEDPGEICFRANGTGYCGNPKAWGVDRFDDYKVIGNDIYIRWEGDTSWDKEFENVEMHDDFWTTRNNDGETYTLIRK